MAKQGKKKKKKINYQKIIIYVMLFATIGMYIMSLLFV